MKDCTGYVLRLNTKFVFSVNASPSSGRTNYCTFMVVSSK